MPVLTEEEQLSEFPVFGEDLFVTGQTNKVKKSRSEKRAERRSHWFENHTAGNDDEAEQAMMMRQSQRATVMPLICQQMK